MQLRFLHGTPTAHVTVGLPPAQVQPRLAAFETDVRDVVATVFDVPQPSVTGQANTAASTVYVRSITANGDGAAVVTFDADVRQGGGRGAGGLGGGYLAHIIFIYGLWEGRLAGTRLAGTRPHPRLTLPPLCPYFPLIFDWLNHVTTLS
jgi:hypothetical protein